MIILETIKRTDPRILANMKVHYSQPKGFVGRNICYAVFWLSPENLNKTYYGSIVGGSATLFLPGRNEFFGISPGKNSDKAELKNIVNNLFFHVEKQIISGFDTAQYPCRNFTTKILKTFRHTISIDWKNKYGDDVKGFESLIELPRTGECYKKDGWQQVGQTVGYTCKRTGGKGTDSWTGKRVWDTDNLRPKLVFVRKV